MRLDLALFFMLAAAAASQDADLLLFNGNIITVRSRFRITDSLAVRGDRIIAVGERAEVAKYAGPRARRVDLRRKTVLPRLIDSHVDAADASLYEFDHADEVRSTQVDTTYPGGKMMYDRR